MNEEKTFQDIAMGFLSRKFMVTLLLFVAVYKLPIDHKSAGVDQATTLACLTILGTIATAYLIANVKDAKNTLIGLLGGKPEATTEEEKPANV
jgi:hypothetical protein